MPHIKQQTQNYIMYNIIGTNYIYMVDEEPTHDTKKKKNHHTKFARTNTLMYVSAAMMWCCNQCVCVWMCVYEMLQIYAYVFGTERNTTPQSHLKSKEKKNYLCICTGSSTCRCRRRRRRWICLIFDNRLL